MSDKKISITIILFALGIGMGYLFFGWGTVEIFVGNQGVFGLELQTKEETKQCENPCEIRIRPGKKFYGEIEVKGFLSEVVRAPKASIFSRKKISIILTPLVRMKRIPIEDFIKKEEARRAPFQKYKEEAMGPVRINQTGMLAVFLRSLSAGKTELVLANKAGKQQRLAIFEDTFLPSILEKNFHFFRHGILIPTTQKIYNYDFITNEKRVLFTGKIFYLASISHKRNGDLITKTEKGWKIISLSGEEKLLDGSIRWAQFSANDLWTVDGTQVKKNQFVVAELPKKVEEKDRIYFDFSDDVNTLWIHRDFEVWRVDL